MELNTTEIGEIFRTVFNGARNFLTPRLIGYRKKHHLVMEISSGDGFEPGTTLFGVTVIEVFLGNDDREDLKPLYVPGLGDIFYRKRNDLSAAPGHDQADVERYITNTIVPAAQSEYDALKKGARRDQQH